MIKLFTIILSLALAIMITASANDYNEIILTHTDGNSTKIQLRSTLEMSFDTENLLFSDSVEVLSFPIKEITAFSFGLSDIQSGIELSQNCDINISYIGNILTISNNLDNTIINLYSLSGVLLNTYNVTSSIEIDMSLYDTGVYLLKINNQTIKIKK